jgi:hypothetical protein
MFNIFTNTSSTLGRDEAAENSKILDPLRGGGCNFVGKTCYFAMNANKLRSRTSCPLSMTPEWLHPSIGGSTLLWVSAAQIKRPGSAARIVCSSGDTLSRCSLVRRAILSRMPRMSARESAKLLVKTNGRSHAWPLKARAVKIRADQRGLSDRRPRQPERINQQTLTQPLTCESARPPVMSSARRNYQYIENTQNKTLEA